MGRAHGGAASARIAKIKNVKRVVMLNAPFDMRATVAAKWMQETSATPADRYYAFFHTADVTYTQYITSFTALGLDPYGPAALVDGASAPYGSKHLLKSSIATPGDGHEAVEIGTATPIGANDVPVFRPVWRYLLSP